MKAILIGGPLNQEIRELPREAYEYTEHGEKYRRRQAFPNSPTPR